MFLKNTKRAFTMLELIFVIVIMGIIGKFGVEFVARAYESFIFSKINNDLQAKSASAVEFIAKRLEHRIKSSTISRNTTAATFNYVNDVGLSDPDATVLEWIATDIDGFRGTTQPSWSAIIDLTATSSNRIISTSSELNTTNTQISVLSYGTADINDSAVYFIGSYLTVNPWGYGAVNNIPIVDQNQTLHPIQSGANTNEIWPKGLIPDFSGREIFEYYKLAWTAYAIELGDYNNTTSIGNLYFYYNYRPWQGDEYTDGTKVLLAEGINTFRYRSAGSLVKIQVCAKSELTGEEYALCKEKTVY